MFINNPSHMTVFINNQGHMIKMAAYGKTIQYLLLRKWWTDFNKTLHVASGPKVLKCVYKSRPCDDLDLFYSKANLVNIIMQKTVKLQLKGKNFSGNRHNDRIIMILKIKLTPGVILNLLWGFIHVHVYDHYNQASLLVHVYISQISGER